MYSILHFGPAGTFSLIRFIEAHNYSCSLLVNTTKLWTIPSRPIEQVTGKERGGEEDGVVVVVRT